MAVFGLLKIMAILGLNCPSNWDRLTLAWSLLRFDYLGSSRNPYSGISKRIRQLPGPFLAPNLAPPERLELPTYAFEVRRSIH